ncbi:GTP cyclohydrolase II [Sphingosinicella sp. LHD-64]|uniref:GTP cyclohydrolase II n=1 Tax=Sphingosinicella sp. LHD-64 TaxID=3072139 RepID=UPI00280D69BD|nr:GTP cyclohydrolase II [Sphingosinicella sp. LHD-64]MDQ8757046.1 GTP cyclohydrolase II [Sphingosinicella sp. LHD-64]
MGARDVARAIDALRRGWPIAVDEVSFLAIETGDETGLAAFDGEGAPASLLISGNRGATLKLANQIEAVPTEPVLIRRAPWIDFAMATAIADPALDLANPFKGPFETAPLCSPPTAVAALRLARLAGLLPALFTRRDGPAETRVTATDVMAFGHGAELRIVSRARLPTKFAEGAEIVAFRADGDTAEHVALLIGSPDGRPPLVRLHSECLTGDVLGSLKCDCGDQLAGAIGAIGTAGWGILLYLRQEGRGIGLVNKLRAYQLQDQGFDTVDANLRLGFQDDERDFGAAARMLEALGQREVRLLTNNPAKVSALEAEGIKVAERVPLKIEPGAHNRTYLATKRDRSGHQL